MNGFLKVGTAKEGLALTWMLMSELLTSDWVVELMED